MHNKHEEPVLITAAMLAEWLNVSERHIHNLRNDGKLPAPVLLGRAVRWNAGEIQAWLAAGAPERKAWEAMRALARKEPLR